MGLQSSAYPVDVDVKAPGTTPAAGVSLLNSKIIVTKEQLQGLSGLFRVYFAAITAAADYQLEIQRNRVGGQYGVGAEAQAIITNGKVSNIIGLQPGNNYPPRVTTIAAELRTIVAISAPTGPDPVTATATAIVERGEIIGYTITNPGNGYLSEPTVTITSTNYVLHVSKFNGDNSFLLKSGGYYRFDIGVRPGDILDFIPAATNLTGILEFRIDQIQIGA